MRKKEPAYVPVIVDEVQLNARHFASMKKDEAIKAMKADGIMEANGITDADAWAGKAYDLAVSAVKRADTPTEDKAPANELKMAPEQIAPKVK